MRKALNMKHQPTLTSFLCLSFVCSFLGKNLDNLNLRHCQGFAWQEICDFSFTNGSDDLFSDVEDNKAHFNPKKVQPGSTIFITCFSASTFFKKIHPKIKSPYILVSQFRSDLAIKYLDDPTIIALFCADHYPSDTYTTACFFSPCDIKPISHKKLTLIPLGIFHPKELFYNYSALDQLFTSLRNKQKPTLLYMNFSLHWWSLLRSTLYQTYKDKPWVKNECKNPKSFESYLQEMAECKFALSPQGDLNDCYRHWEAILCGVIPIIQKTSISSLFDGLPVLLVDRWTEINEDFLNQKYIEISSKQYNLEKLYMKFWVDKINKIKQDFLSQTK
jgi:hypothetical protein